jgi:hypothetical protein
MEAVLLWGRKMEASVMIHFSEESFSALLKRPDTQGLQKQSQKITWPGLSTRRDLNQDDWIPTLRIRDYGCGLRN